MSKTTTLGQAQLTPSTQTISVQLVEPADLPAVVQIHWPPQPSIIDPKNFGDVAAAVVRMFSEAHVALAAIKSSRRLS
jgi:hypothetical protein